MDAPPAELLLAQTEDYVEYSRHGTVIKGQERAVACSKYEEDVKINNHTVCVKLEPFCVLLSILLWIIFLYYSVIIESLLCFSFSYISNLFYEIFPKTGKM